MLPARAKISKMMSNQTSITFLFVLRTLLLPLPCVERKVSALLLNRSSGALQPTKGTQWNLLSLLRLGRAAKRSLLRLLDFNARPLTACHYLPPRAFLRETFRFLVEPPRPPRIALRPEPCASASADESLPQLGPAGIGIPPPLAPTYRFERTPFDITVSLWSNSDVP